MALPEWAVTPPAHKPWVQVHSGSTIVHVWQAWLPSASPRDSGWGGSTHSSICTRSPVESALIPLRFGRQHVWMKRAIISISAEDQNPIFRKVFNAELNKASSKSSPPSLSLSFSLTHTNTDTHARMCPVIFRDVKNIPAGKLAPLTSAPLRCWIIHILWLQISWRRNIKHKLKMYETEVRPPRCCRGSPKSSQNILVIRKGSMGAHFTARAVVYGAGSARLSCRFIDYELNWIKRWPMTHR